MAREFPAKATWSIWALKRACLKRAARGSASAGSAWARAARMRAYSSRKTRIFARSSKFPCPAMQARLPARTVTLLLQHRRSRRPRVRPRARTRPRPGPHGSHNHSTGDVALLSRRSGRWAWPSGDVSREVAPHFAASLGDVLFRDVGVEILPKSAKTAARLLRPVLLLQEVH